MNCTTRGRKCTVQTAPGTQGSNRRISLRSRPDVFSITQRPGNPQRAQKVLEEVRIEDTPENEKSYIENIITKNHELFQVADEPLRATNAGYHRILTTTDTPFQKAI